MDHSCKFWLWHIIISISNTIKWDKCISTTKYGLLEGYHVDIWADGGQNWLRSNLALNEHAWDPRSAKPQQTVQFMTWKLLQQNGGPTSWTAFSSTRYCRSHAEKPEYWLSLEMIHNNIHVGVQWSQTIESKLTIIGLCWRIAIHPSWWKSHEALGYGTHGQSFSCSFWPHLLHLSLVSNYIYIFDGWF